MRCTMVRPRPAPSTPSDNRWKARTRPRAARPESPARRPPPASRPRTRSSALSRVASTNRQRLAPLAQATQHLRSFAPRQPQIELRHIVSVVVQRAVSLQAIARPTTANPACRTARSRPRGGRRKTGRRAAQDRLSQGQENRAPQGQESQQIGRAGCWLRARQAVSGFARTKNRAFRRGFFRPASPERSATTVCAVPSPAHGIPVPGAASCSSASPAARRISSRSTRTSCRGGRGRRS